MEPSPHSNGDSRARPTHPSEETLENYALGRLSEPEVAAVETHLLTCASCQEALTEADEYTGAMKAALQERHVAPQAAGLNLMERLREQVRHPHPLTAFSMGVAVLALVAVVSYQPEPVGPDAVTLRSVRGAADAAEGRAGASLALTIQSAEWNVDATFRVKIVDAAGKDAWSGVPVVEEGRGVVRVADGLAAGTYWVRLYSPAGSLLQEYGLRLR